MRAALIAAVMKQRARRMSGIVDPVPGLIASLTPSYWWDFAQPAYRAVDTGLFTAVADRVAGAATMLSDPSLGPLLDGNAAVFNGLSQYMYTQDAGVLALCDGDDEPLTIALFGSITGSEATGRAAGWCTTGANRHVGFGGNATGDGYLMQRVSTQATAVATRNTSEALWLCRFTAGGLTNRLTHGTTTAVGPSDMSAAGAFAGGGTHFMLGARYNSATLQQWLGMTVKHCALFARAISDADRDALIAGLA